MAAAKVYGVISTVISTSTVGAVVSPQVQGVSPTLVPFVGAVPVFSVGVGVLTAFLVRWVSRSNDKSKLWGYNAAVTVLAMLGAAVFIIDHQVGPGNSFWVGGSFGATGAGMVGAMRSKLFVAIIEGLKGGFMRGIAPPLPPGDDGGSKSE